MAFEEAEVLARFDRSYGDKHEELRLERGEYNGRPTFTLRLYWQAQAGAWRWAAQKPTQSGKCWERMGVKARELRDLAAALVAAADDLGDDAERPRVKDNPQRRAERDRFDRRGSVPAGDDEIPF